MQNADLNSMDCRQKQSTGVVLKKVSLEILQNSREAPLSVSLFNKVSGLQTATLLRILTGKKHPKTKTPALTKNMDINIWVIGTSNKLILRGSKTGTNFPNKFLAKLHSL